MGRGARRHLLGTLLISEEMCALTARTSGAHVDAREGQSWVTLSSRQSLGMNGVGVEDEIGWAGYISANNCRQRGSQRRCCQGKVDVYADEVEMCCAGMLLTTALR